jgi:hypothetical protein
VSKTATVYVPREGTVAARVILPGSGIVGNPISTQNLLVFFEGNKYGVADLDKFEARVRRAYDSSFYWKANFKKQQPRAATTARMATAVVGMIPVGTFDGEVLRVYNEELLNAWVSQYEGGQER